MTKVFIPVSVKDELPKSKGYFFCFIDGSPYDDHFFDPGNNIVFPPDVTHWLKEVVLPGPESLKLSVSGLNPHEDAPILWDVWNRGLQAGINLVLNLLTPVKNDK